MDLRAYAFSKSITEDDRMPEQLGAAARRHCAVCFRMASVQEEFDRRPATGAGRKNTYSLDIAGPVTVDCSPTKQGEAVIRRAGSALDNAVIVAPVRIRMRSHTGAGAESACCD